MKQVKKSLEEIAPLIKARIHGDAQCIVNSVASIEDATEGQITFFNVSLISQKKYLKYLSTTKASAVILAEEYLDECPTNALVVNDPYFAYAQLAKMFSSEPEIAVGIHPTAIIGEDCNIDLTARIGAHVVIQKRVSVGANSRISEGCVICQDSHIGCDCYLWPNVTLYHEVTLGDRVFIHSGAVIGSDGFGFAPQDGGWNKIPQIGGVQIGDDVEIGANTSIDRGALKDTIIGNGVKLDNQIQIGHNVSIGDHTIMAGCVGVAGSTTIGKHCMFGGGAGVSGHISITDNVMVTGMAQISNSIKEPGHYSSGTGFMKHDVWRKNIARFHHLDRILRKLLAAMS